MDRDLLSDYGIDYDKGLKNCMGNTDFFKKILSMFLKDNCFQRAEAALASRNYNELFKCMHELKGISGNTALTELYNTTIPLVELLRSAVDTNSEADYLFAAVAREYRRACEGIAVITAELQ